jgi:hypothetical protein
MERRFLVNVAVMAALLAMPSIVHASTVYITLDSNFAPPDYQFYTYTDTDGVVQSNIPVGPYMASASGDGYNNSNVFVWCYDFNNPTYVGTQYSGTLSNISLADSDFQAEMEASYLMNMLYGAGGINAPASLRGPVSMAIWEIMYPSSDNNSSPFPTDPNALQYETQAAAAVSGGAWTLQDALQYPTWVPDDPSVQRFGGFVNVINPQDSSTPEPATFLLIGGGLVALGIRRYSRR